VGKQNQGEPVGFRVDPVCEALHRSYSGMANTAQFLGGNLRTRSGQQDASAHISSLIDSIRTQLALDDGADAGKVPRR
jgi:hypothetical protein